MTYTGVVIIYCFELLQCRGASAMNQDTHVLGALQTELEDRSCPKCLQSETREDTDTGQHDRRLSQPTCPEALVVTSYATEFPRVTLDSWSWREL